jgi:hypothetical protein
MTQYVAELKGIRFEHLVKLMTQYVAELKGIRFDILSHHMHLGLRRS